MSVIRQPHANKRGRYVDARLDAMRIVDEAVQNGVGVSGVANDLVPGGQRELGGDDRRSAAVALFEDFEQIVTGAGVEGFEAEVVENEEIGAAEGFRQARMARPGYRSAYQLAGNLFSPRKTKVRRQSG